MTKAAPTIAERIARTQPTLSPKQHKMAEYVLAHPFRVATMTIDEFAAEVEVSVATANRFARALDLPGYPQFRAELAHAASVAQIFVATLEEDIRNARRTLQSVDAAACEQAVDAILAADRVFIIGFGASGFLAGMLQRSLCMHLHAVESLAGPGGVSHAARQMSRMTGKDLLIAIGFPRYLADTVTLAGAARQAGVPVLALTDKPTSPLAPTASVALYAVSARRLLPSSETAALGLIEALSAAVAYRASNSVGVAAPVRPPVMPWLVHGVGKR